MLCDFVFMKAEKAFQTELGCVDVGLNFSHIKFPKFMSFCEQDNHMLYKMPNEKIFLHNAPKNKQIPIWGRPL